MTGERNTAFDVGPVLAETLALLTVRPDGAGGETWIGEAPNWFGAHLFGGFVIAQAIMAATRNAPEARRLHSMHAYFLRPASAADAISYRVRPIREVRRRHVIPRR